MDRYVRSSYVHSGPRSLPHMGSKRHVDSRGPRLSPPAQPHHTNQHDDLIHYIYDAWNKVTKEIERGSDDAKYYQEVTPRQLANFRPFNLEEWWDRKVLQTGNRNKHRS